MAEATSAVSFAPAPAARTPPDGLPRVCGVAVATPDRTLDQREMLGLLGLTGDPFAEEVFARSGVERRQLEATPETIVATLQERTERTEEQLLELAMEAIERLDVDAREVGVVVTANYYSLGGPTLAHRLVERCGFAPDTDKYHVVGVGCASAVPLLRLAGQALRDRPGGDKALVVAAESVSGFLTGAGPDAEKVKVVGSALFGDGCAAAVLELGPGATGPALIASKVHQVPGTLDHVRFAVSGDDSHMRMARELPELAQTGLGPLVSGFLREQGIDRGAIDHWLVHPGGRGILEGIQKGLRLSDEDVAPSADVLARHGNVGTPSAFYVLRATLDQRRPGPGDRGLMITIGPGVTIGLMLLQW